MGSGTPMPVRCAARGARAASTPAHATPSHPPLLSRSISDLQNRLLTRAAALEIDQHCGVLLFHGFIVNSGEGIKVFDLFFVDAHDHVVIAQLAFGSGIAGAYAGDDDAFVIIQLALIGIRAADVADGDAPGFE